MRDRLKHTVCSVTLVFAALAGVQAQTIESSEFGVTGTLNSDGSFRMDIVPGDFDTEAILVVSQPSRTLLAAVMDTAFLATKQGQALDANVQKSARSSVTGDLSRMKPAVLLPDGPPTSDESIQVLVYGTFQGKRLNGFEVINSRISTPSERPTSFGLFARLEITAQGIVDITETCCRCGNPPDECGCVTDCTSSFCDCINCTMTCND